MSSVRRLNRRFRLVGHGSRSFTFNRVRDTRNALLPYGSRLRIVGATGKVILVVLDRSLF